VELRHLRYFVAVAEIENVSRAALKLHVSQPALSRQIRDLEDELGFSLLERTAKSVRLTDAGRAFRDDARALLQNADDAVTKARAVASAEPTELHVGYSPTPVAEILPKVLRAFQQAMPNVPVTLRDWSNKDILDGIRDGRLQLGLIVPPPRRLVRCTTCDMRSCFTNAFVWRSPRSIRLPDAVPFRLQRLRPNR
jgi:LysR family transcriptional regulator, benzoate and cis,cis-muconate-responsive activator of ben and cat genes